MRKPRIYIAGPMRGLPEYNYPQFNGWAVLYRSHGWYVENPAEIAGAFGTPDEIEADPALRSAVTAADTHALEMCDAILLLKGWERSEGARRELQTALAAGLKIFLAPVVVIPLVGKDTP